MDMEALYPFASFKFNIFLLFLALAIWSSSARILDEVGPAPEIAPEASVPADIPVSTTTTLGATAGGGSTIGTAGGASTIAAGGASTIGTAGGASTIGTAGGASTIAAGGASTTGTVGGASTIAAGGASAAANELTFFMHDILGGTNPSAKAVTGIVDNPAAGGQVPFAKPNGAILPTNNGVPANNANSGLINNNNIPFLTGLSGASPNVVQTNGNNLFTGGNGFPVVNGAQLSAGTTIQNLMFGTLTVIDDELTDGEALGSTMVGKAEGFYIVSSEDGTSQTMLLTTTFEESGYVDSLCFFGVHRTAVSESQLAIMGGTGKYAAAKGFATVKTLQPIDPHETDGVETVLQFTVYVTY